MSVTPIPKEVYRYLDVVYRDESALVGDVTCRCGGKTFYILRNTDIREASAKKEEARKRAEEYFRRYGKKPNRTEVREGKIYLQRVGLFGKVKAEFCLTDAEGQTDPAVVVKAKCVGCGEEILLFDSEKHAENHESIPRRMEPYRLIGSDAQTARIRMKYRFDGFSELSEEERSAREDRVCFDSVEIDAFATDVKDRRQEVLRDTDYWHGRGGFDDDPLL